MINLGVIDAGPTFSSGADSYTGSNGATVQIPTNAAAGDFAILYDMALSSTATPPTFVVPSGWTHIAGATGSNDSGLGIRSTVTYKVLTSGDPGLTITGMNGSERDRKIMIVMRPSRAIQSVVAGGWVSRLGGGDPSSITVSISALVAPVTVFAFAAAQNVISPFTWTPAADGTNSSGVLVTRAGYAHYDSGPTNHSINTDDEGDTNGLSAGYVQFT